MKTRVTSDKIPQNHRVLSTEQNHQMRDLYRDAFGKSPLTKKQHRALDATYHLNIEGIKPHERDQAAAINSEVDAVMRKHGLKPAKARNLAADAVVPKVKGIAARQLIAQWTNVGRGLDVVLKAHELAAQTGDAEAAALANNPSILKTLDAAIKAIKRGVDSIIEQQQGDPLVQAGMDGIGKYFPKPDTVQSVDEYFRDPNALQSVDEYFADPAAKPRACAVVDGVTFSLQAYDESTFFLKEAAIQKAAAIRQAIASGNPGDAARARVGLPPAPVDIDMSTFRF